MTSVPHPGALCCIRQARQKKCKNFAKKFANIKIIRTFVPATTNNTFRDMATFELTDIIKRRAREVASATRYLLENYSWPNLKALTDRVFWLASQYIGDAPGEQDFYRWLIWQTSETMGFSF